MTDYGELSFEEFSPLRTDDDAGSRWALKRSAAEKGGKEPAAKRTQLQYPAFTQIDSRLEKIRLPSEKAGCDEDDWDVDCGESPLNPFELEESEINRQMRLEHQNQRVMLVQDMLDQAAETRRRLTPGEAKLRKILDGHKTNDDLASRVSADFGHGLITVPAVSPATDYVNTALGLPDAPHEEQCPACNSGMEARGIDSKLLTDFKSAIEQFQDSIRDPVELCKMISRAWEYHVKRPANKNIAEGEAEVASWTPAGVYLHFTTHVKEPSVVKHGLLDIWRELVKIIAEQKVYSVTAQFARTGQRPGSRDLHVSSEGLAQLKLATEMVVKLMVLDERKIPGYRPALRFERSSTGIIANQITERVEETEINSVFNDRRDWRV